MEFKQYYKHFFGYSLRLLSDTKKFWKWAQENKNDVEVFRHFYVPYLVLAGIAVFFGNILSSPEILLSYCIMSGIREAVTFLISFFVATVLIGKLAEYFKGTNDDKAIESLIGFSMLPVLVGSIITGMFPGLYVLEIINLYSLYLFYTGISFMLDIPIGSKRKFAATAIITGAVTYSILSMTFWKLLQAFI